MGEGGIDEVAAVYTVKGVEGEIQAKHSYGGGCRACCLTEWSGRPKGGGLGVPGRRLIAEGAPIGGARPSVTVAEL